MTTPGNTWPRCPEATQLLDSIYSRFLSSNPEIERMRNYMRSKAGVALHHLIDHWALPVEEELTAQLLTVGFVHRLTVDGDAQWVHPQASLPRIRFDGDLSSSRMAIRVESIDDFIDAWDLPTVGRRGDEESGYEEARFPVTSGEIAVIVRSGYSGFRPGELKAGSLRALNSVRDRLAVRPRPLDAATALSTCSSMVAEIIEEIGMERTADEFFATERRCYMERNRAAQIQYRLQQSIGIGWANQDHHTYRSSRLGFQGLISLWKQFGFVCRERYYAGAEAGWGAQIMEHPVSRVVIFSDVDIAPDELDIDFSEQPLAHHTELGTIGLWCGLHGDSIGAAGMHHLECEFDFSAAEEALKTEGISTMKPFTDLPMLKQAFTAGEIWQVQPACLEALLQAGSITAAQAERFQREGATGSHLELLQRWEGFRGFNKTGVSAIIRATDARI